MSLLHFYYSRTKEISLDKNVTTEVTQYEKSEKEPSDEESKPSMGTPTESHSNKEQKVLGYRKRFRRAIQRCPEQSFAGLSRCKGRSQRFVTHCSNSCQGRLSHCKDQAQVFATWCSNGCRERISRWTQTAIWLQFTMFARTSFCLAKFSLNSAPVQLILGLTFYRVSCLFIFKNQIKDYISCWEGKKGIYEMAFK